VPYTTNELITRSWYLSGVVARDLATVSGDQLNDGLNMLNALLSFKTSDQKLIPYFDDYEFNAVINQEKYFIPNLILTETLTFDLNTVRYQMTHQNRYQYFGTPRAQDVSSLPYIYHCERTKGGTNLFMYFLPNDTYPFTIHGKFSLANVVLGQDLSLTLDPFYIEYLRYALGEYMAQEYNIMFQPGPAAQLKAYEAMLVDTSPIDFTMRKQSALQRREGPDIYALANLSVGYLPS
jgi:hypothetical protein